MKRLVVIFVIIVVLCNNTVFAAKLKTQKNNEVVISIYDSIDEY